MTALLTPSSLKLGLYSCLNVAKIPSSSRTLNFSSSLFSATPTRALRSSSTRCFASPASTVTFDPFPLLPTTLPRSLLSTSLYFLSSSSFLTSTSRISLSNCAMLARTPSFSALALSTISSLFLIALAAVRCLISSSLLHSLPMGPHLSGHLTPPTPAHSSLPSQHTS